MVVEMWDRPVMWTEECVLAYVSVMRPVRSMDVKLTMETDIQIYNYSVIFFLKSF